MELGIDMQKVWLCPQKVWTHVLTCQTGVNGGKVLVETLWNAGGNSPVQSRQNWHNPCDTSVLMPFSYWACELRPTSTVNSECAISACFNLDVHLLHLPVVSLIDFSQKMLYTLSSYCPQGSSYNKPKIWQQQTSILSFIIVFPYWQGKWARRDWIARQAVEGFLCSKLGVTVYHHSMHDKYLKQTNIIIYNHCGPKIIIWSTTREALTESTIQKAWSGSGGTFQWFSNWFSFPRFHLTQTFVAESRVDIHLLNQRWNHLLCSHKACIDRLNLNGNHPTVWTWITCLDPPEELPETQVRNKDVTFDPLIHEIWL